MSELAAASSVSVPMFSVYAHVESIFASGSVIRVPTVSWKVMASVLSGVNDMSSVAVRPSASGVTLMFVAREKGLGTSRGRHDV